MYLNMFLIIFHPRQVKAKMNFQFKMKTNKSRNSYIRDQKIRLSCRVKQQCIRNQIKAQNAKA